MTSTPTQLSTPRSSSNPEPQCQPPAPGPPSGPPHVLVNYDVLKDMQEAIISLTHALKGHDHELVALREEHLSEIKVREGEKTILHAKVKQLTDRVEELETSREELEMTVLSLQKATSDLLEHADHMRCLVEARPEGLEALDRLHLRAALDRVEAALAKTTNLLPSTTYQWRIILAKAEADGLSLDSIQKLTLEERNRRRLAKGRELLRDVAKDNPIIQAILNNAAAMRLVTKKNSTIRAGGNAIAHHVLSSREMLDIIGRPKSFISEIDFIGLKILFALSDSV